MNEVEHQEDALDPAAIEQEATVQGWVSKENYKGNPEEWVDAETFVRRGREINPILRANNERLRRELTAAQERHQREMAEIKTTISEFRKFHAQTEERAYENALADLKKQRAEAQKDLDSDRVVDIDDAIHEIRELRAAKKEIPAAVESPATPSPEFTAWAAQNTWYSTDPELQAFADQVAGPAVRRLSPASTGREFLEAVRETVMERYPERFGQTTAVPRVEGTAGVRPAKSNGKKSYAALPAEAKEACDKFVRQGLLTQEEYLNSYQW